MPRILLNAALGLLLCAAGIRAQSSYTGAFERHSVQVNSFDSNCAFHVVKTTYATSVVTIPVSSGCQGDTVSGQIVLTFPATAPAASMAWKAGYDFQLSSPLTTSVELTGSWAPQVANSQGQISILSLYPDQSYYPPNVECPMVFKQVKLPLGSAGISEKRSCSVTHVNTGVSATEMVVSFNYRVSVKIDGWLAPPTGPPHSTGTELQVDIVSSYRFTESAPLELSVDHLEVVQVVQDAANTVPLVAGKSTVARVFATVKGDKAQTGVSGTLRGYRDDRELAGSPLATSRKGTKSQNGLITVSKTFNRESIDDSLNFLLPKEWISAGALKLVAEINPPSGIGLSATSKNTLTQSVEFKPAPPQFWIAYWPICYQPTADAAAECPSDEIGTLDELVRKVYPVADDGIQYFPLQVPSATWSRSLNSLEGEQTLVANLRKIYHLVDQFSLGLDQLAGWVPHTQGIAHGGISDPVWYKHGGAGRVSWSLDTSGTVDRLNAAQILSHEIGHNLGLRHPNTADSCGAMDDSVPDEIKWPTATAAILEPGIDPSTMEVKSGAKKDIMTGGPCAQPGSNIWISPFSYKRLMASTLLNPASAPAGTNSVSRRESAASRKADPAEYLVISGTASRDGTAGQLGSAYRVTSSSPGDAPDSAGNHCLRFSASGVTLADHCFSLTFVPDGHEFIERESFSLKIPYPAGFDRIALLREGQELAAVPVSGEVPVLDIVTPQPGERWDGRRTITWSGYDPGGNPLSYAVLYSSDDGNTWLPMRVDLAEPQFAFDTAQIKAGRQIHFRVLASSGVNTTSRTVGPIEIVETPKIDSRPAALDFGPLLSGQSAELSFTLGNKGNGPVAVGSIQSDNAAFGVVPPSTPFTIPVGGRQTVTVRFSAAATGAQSGALVVASNDPARAALKIPLSGVSVASLAARADLTPAALDFGSVVAGQTKDLTLVVRNTGGATLAVSGIASSNARFAVTSPSTPFSIPVAGQQEVTVRFSPAATGAQSGSLSVSSNAEGRPAIAVSLTGQGAGSTPPPAPAPTVLFSDSFNRADADRCSLGRADLALGGSGTHYYLPVFTTGATIASNMLQNSGKNYGGMQFAGAPGCVVRGENVGQDLNIKVDLLVPTDAAGHISQAGPYLRGRAAAPSDGILGGESAGYWIQLHSTGEVKVRNLNSAAIVATSGRPTSFDNTTVHRLEVAAQGVNLQVALDGRLLTFSQGTSQTTTLGAPATGGSNQGTAGVAFGSADNPGLIGGQRADNLVITAFSSLAALPVQSNLAR